MVTFGGVFASVLYSDIPMEALPTEAETKYINVYILPHPQNEYDPLTIAVYCCSNKKMIGYMLNSDAHLLASLIEHLNLPSMDTSAIINSRHALSNPYVIPIYLEFFIDPYSQDPLIADLSWEANSHELLSKLGLRPSTPLKWQPDGLYILWNALPDPLKACMDRCYANASKPWLARDLRLLAFANGLVRHFGVPLSLRVLQDGASYMYENSVGLDNPLDAALRMMGGGGKRTELDRQVEEAISYHERRFHFHCTLGAPLPHLL